MYNNIWSVLWLGVTPLFLHPIDPLVQCSDTQCSGISKFRHAFVFKRQLNLEMIWLIAFELTAVLEMITQDKKQTWSYQRIWVNPWTSNIRMLLERKNELGLGKMNWDWGKWIGIGENESGHLRTARCFSFNVTAS